MLLILKIKERLKNNLSFFLICAIIILGDSMNKQKLLRYILMKREIEMGMALEEDQLDFFNKMENIINSDDELQRKINMLLNTDSMQKMNNIMKNGYVEEQPNIEFESKIEQPNNAVEFRSKVEIPVTEPEGGTSIAPAAAEMGNQLVLRPNTSRKAGFIDALVMALVTGFVGGVATTILFILL